MNWKAILQSLAAAAIGGTATALAGAVSLGNTKGLGWIAIAGAATGVSALLKSSPINAGK